MSFVSVTEKPGIRIARRSEDARCAVRICHELLCGPRHIGSGLRGRCGPGLARTRARTVVGGDFDETLLQTAQETYRDRISLIRLDAHCLPFSDASFDVVLLLEAIYYLAYPARFIRECRRVLRRDGVLLICTANKEWRGFNPSPFSRRYLSSEELRQLLVASEFGAEIFGDFPAAIPTLALRVVFGIRRLAVLMHLIPKTMKGKEWLKRLFYGELVSLDPEIHAVGPSPEPVHLIGSGTEATRYKVLYAVGHVLANNSSPYSDNSGQGQASLIESAD